MGLFALWEWQNPENPISILSLRGWQKLDKSHGFSRPIGVTKNRKITLVYSLHWVAKRKSHGYHTLLMGVTKIRENSTGLVAPAQKSGKTRKNTTDLVTPWE